MAIRFVLNETSYFGNNAREVLAEEIKKGKFKKVFWSLTEAETYSGSSWDPDFWHLQWNWASGVHFQCPGYCHRGKRPFPDQGRTDWIWLHKAPLWK